MMKKFMFHVGQRPKYTRTKVGAFAQLGYLNQIKAANFLLAPEYYKTDTFSNILDYFNRSLLEDTGPNNNELYNFLNKELNVYCLNNFHKKIIKSEGNSYKWSK